jgi:hypothetical protein
VKKQKKFSPRDYRNDSNYQMLDGKFRAAGDLEYATLLGHVIIEDQLLTLLAARLGADAMPSIRGFDMISGLALARSKSEHLRDAAGWLNGARNEVGHKMHRKTFSANVERFVRAVKGSAGEIMTWPSDEGEQVSQLRLAIRFFMVELAIAIEYEENVRSLGNSALQAAAKKSRRGR